MPSPVNEEPVLRSDTACGRLLGRLGLLQTPEEKQKTDVEEKNLIVKEKYKKRSSVLPLFNLQE